MERAETLARELGFERSSEPEMGPLLHVLAAQRGRARVAEIGTGTGVGAAWIVAGLPPDVPFFTAELDERRAAAAADLFRDDPQVRVLHGDWRDVLPPEAPFDLVFYDADKNTDPQRNGPRVVDMLAPGATVVMDDLWERRQYDPLREFWLNHPQLAATEVLVTPQMAAILGVRAL